MSTKIYNGIKFKSTNYREVLDQLIDIKKKSILLVNELIKDRDIFYL
jgi:hypothetical protein